MSTKCKSCGEYIFWATTTAGKRIPLNKTPMLRFVIATGLAADSQNPHVSYVPTYETHFATCQNADSHRKMKCNNSHPYRGEKGKP